MGNHCENKTNIAPRGCCGVRNTHATIKGNRTVDLESPELTDPRSTMRGVNMASMSMRTSNCTCGLVAAPFKAVFCSLEDRWLGNTVEGCILVNDRQKI